MKLLRASSLVILEHRLAKRTQRSQNSARSWWQRFGAVTGMPQVLDLDFEKKSNVLLLRDVFLCFMQFIRENQRHHDKDRGVGHHETPARYCTPVMKDHEKLGIDLKAHLGSTIKDFTKGLGRFQLEHYGPRKKRHKRPYTIALLSDMYDLSWSGWCEGDAELEIEIKAALQVGIGVGFRKSEFLEGDEVFNFNVHLTKSHVKYFDNDWQLVIPSPEIIRRLLAIGGWALVTTANLKQDQLQEKWRNFPLPFRIGPEMAGCLLAPGFWLALKELKNPVLAEFDRERLPLFMHPRKHEWLKSTEYRRVISKVLLKVHHNKGMNLSQKEIDEMFATHSARVTQQVLGAAVNMPTHVRKMVGRYSSAAFEDYDRMELERVHSFLKQMNEATITSLHTLNADTPCFPSMRTVSPGQSYTVQLGEVIVDPMHQVGNANVLKTQVMTAEKTNALEGRKVRKWFGDRFYDGSVTKIDEYYHVVYDDGDQEDVTLDELVDIILPTQN